MGNKSKRNQRARRQRVEPSVQIDANRVIAKLQEQVSRQALDLAVKDSYIDQAHERIAALEAHVVDMHPPEPNGAGDSLDGIEATLELVEDKPKPKPKPKPKEAQSAN